MQMKNGTEFSAKKPVARIPSSTGGGNNSATAGLLLGPKKAIDFNTANDDDFWYGDKKDRRFGNLTTHKDLPPIPDKLKSDLQTGGDGLRASQSGMRRPLPPNQASIGAANKAQNGIYVTNPSNSQLEVDQSSPKS